MFSTAPISHSRIRYPSSSDFSPMMRPAPPTWRKPAGETALPARTAARRESRSTLKTALASCAAASAARNTGLTVGTVMERSHTPLNVWFWAAYLVASQTPGMSALQFQRQLGLSRYETAFQILHKLRSGMVRPNQDRIGGQPKNHVEVANAGMGDRRGREHPWRAPLYPVCAHSSPSGCGCNPDRQGKIYHRDTETQKCKRRRIHHQGTNTKGPYY